MNNCLLTYNSADLHEADAVIFHLHRTKSASTLPRRENFRQRWVFLTDESPINTFLYRNQSLADYDGLFNWSMTYRFDSDVPVPYGRTVLATAANEVDGIAQFTSLEKRDKDRLVAVLGSNCSGKNDRWLYVQKLKDILGEWTMT